MQDEDRISLIRQGNAALNQKKIAEAASLFRKAGYSSGLERISEVLIEAGHLKAAITMMNQNQLDSKADKLAEEMAAVMQLILSTDKAED